MIAYASRTGTRRNLESLRAHGWRLLVSAANDLRMEGFPYALDNGAWSYHQQGVPFDGDRFERAVSLLGERADWVVCPDKVGDADETVRMAREWLPRLYRPRCQRVLIAVQDGMEPSDVVEFIHEHGTRQTIGVFLGGSTEWKLRTMQAWGDFCQLYDLYFHVARVNTARRIRAAAFAGAQSIDGTSATRFADTIEPLDAARRLGTLLGPAECGDPDDDYEADADLVRRELATYRDDERVEMPVGALRILLNEARQRATLAVASGL